MDSKNGKDYGFNKKNTKPGNSDKSSQRFLEAHNRLQASVKKHLSASKEYDESSEEDDLESETILGSVLKSYAQIGGKSEDLGRTQNFLEDTFQSGAATCLICIVTVKRNEAIWSCNKCFCFFHLQCIQRWSKDSIHYQKVALEERQLSISQIVWSCPKCRNEFSSKDIPKFYLCFCEKKENPEFQPWLVPHSCGETCNKPLIPKCGHKCLLLCHPGPCPPCPNTVSSMCHCGKNGPRPQRCSNKNWSCGKVCGRKLKCNRHFCTDICHGDNCPPCPQKSKQSCQCAKNLMIRDCAEPLWSCTEICGKSLKCGYHSCKQICHKGDCGECPLTLPRQCPCGKTSLLLSCIEDVPTCKDTCGRTLDCGVHTCSQRCHKDKCGGCLERRIKKCRCGLHFKEMPCQKDYICESKCKQIKDCNRHPCNRKCCDGSCSPCEKPCGRTLSCGNHKCTSICHQGQCYPCGQTEIVMCHCRGTKIIVPCGRKKKTRPPKCSKACKIPSDCHHDSREPHRCHFGSCPPCQKTCGLVKGLCAHICKKKCHSAVLVDIHDGMRAIGPWEKITPQLELRALPCGDCEDPVLVSCLGAHEVMNIPCYRAKPYSCGRSCGRSLPCGNHFCLLSCHQVGQNTSSMVVGENCEECNKDCEFERPQNCNHPCPKPCHKGKCPPCLAIVRIRCHCTLNQLIVRCGEWISANDEEKIKMKTCGNQCPKNYACGHRCINDCHPGECLQEDLCNQKVKVSCNCKRQKKDFHCSIVRSGKAVIPCDNICFKNLDDEKKKKENEEIQRKLLEELHNKKELEKYEKKLQGRKKHRERKVVRNTVPESVSRSYWLPFFFLFLAILTVLIIWFFK